MGGRGHRAVIFLALLSCRSHIAGQSGIQQLTVGAKLGRESGDMTEIRTGLEKGQQVVVSGQFLIDSESSLKATLNRMNEAGGKP